MKLLDALIEKTGIRVTCGYRWLVIDDEGFYFVYEKKPYQKNKRTIIETEDEDSAVNALVTA